MDSILLDDTPVFASEHSLHGQWLNNRVCAGFPSPAEDLGGKRIDLTEILMVHPQATYFIRARGLSMIEAGIFDGDILVVDKALQPDHGDIVVAIVDNEFAVKRLYQVNGRMKLLAANPTFPSIVPKDGQFIELWGVVTASIKQFRNRS